VGLSLDLDLDLRLDLDLDLDLDLRVLRLLLRSMQRGRNHRWRACLHRRKLELASRSCAVEER
jgi:hypothetical protein